MRRRLSMALAALLAGATGAAAATHDTAPRDAGGLPPGSPRLPDSTAAGKRGKKGGGESPTLVTRLEARGERLRKERAAERAKRAPTGEQVAITITYYCLKGTTRTDNPVREGIVAADPRVFPLRRHVDVTAHGRPLGRFLVDDTGAKVKGNHLDIWTPDCGEARRLGRHAGTATLVEKGGKKESDG